jgi:hypothetical protein
MGRAYRFDSVLWSFDSQDPHYASQVNYFWIKLHTKHVSDDVVAVVCL